MVGLALSSCVHMVHAMAPGTWVPLGRALVTSCSVDGLEMKGEDSVFDDELLPRHCVAGVCPVCTGQTPSLAFCNTPGYEQVLRPLMYR